MLKRTKDFVEYIAYTQELINLCFDLFDIYIRRLNDDKQLNAIFDLLRKIDETRMNESLMKRNGRYTGKRDLLKEAAKIECPITQINEALNGNEKGKSDRRRR